MTSTGKSTLRCARGLLAVLLLAAATAGAASSAPALADAGPTTLSALPGGDYLAVDDANQHVFVTGLPPSAPYDTNQTVEVLNFDGSVSTTLTVPGAEGLAVAKGDLYVAGCGTPTITVFDLATLAEVRTITLQENMGYPCALAAAGSRLLFDADTGNGFSNPAYIPISANKPEVQWSDSGTSSPAFAVNPAVPGLAVTTSLTGSSSVDELWNVSRPQPLQLGTASGIESGAPADSAALTPDGANLFVAGSGVVQQYALPAFTPGETLSNRSSAQRVALNADASFMAAGLALPGDVPGVDIFNATRMTPIHWITLAGATGAVRALAFSADSSKLFVVTEPDSGPPQLFVIDNPTLAASLISLGANPTATAPGETVQLQGILTLQDGTSGAGASVDITEDRPDGTTTDLGPATAGAGGIYSLPSEELSQIGTYTFTATYAGDSTHLGSTARTTVAVARGVTKLSLASSVGHIVYGQGATLTAHLTGAPTGSPVTITRNVSGTKSVVTTRGTDSDGLVTVTVKPNQRTVYTASFAGNAGYFPSTAPNPVTVTVSPVLGGTLSKPYAVSSGYSLYHYNSTCAASATSCPVFTETLKPANPGLLVYAIVQQRSAKGWVKVAKWAGHLDSQSAAAIKLRYATTSVIGQPFRVLAQFLATSKLAGANKGYWYFKITK